MMKAVRIHGKKDLRVEMIPIPEPAEGFVQLKISCVGLCHTDLHLFEEARIDHIVITEPMTIGHEISGTVSKLGQGVTGLKVGDRVAVDVVHACGQCVQCEKHRPNICANVKLTGVKQLDGGFAEYMIQPANMCHKLPENVSMGEGALMEPLSVSVNAMKRARVEPGDSVIVIGAGPVGLFAMQCAKAMGATKALVVDPKEANLALASKMGADVTMKPPMTSDPKEAAEVLIKALGGAADLCVECSGAKGTVDISILSCRPGGRVMMLGFGAMQMNVHIGTAAINEIDVLGTIANLNNFPECVDLVSSGKVDVKSAISHRLTLDDVMKGLDLIRTGKSVRVLIDCAAS